MTPHFHAVLEGQMPSGKNRVRLTYINGRQHRFPNERFEAWRSNAYAQLARQVETFTPIASPAHVSVRYVPGDLIGRDVPGMMDALCHLFEWCPAHGRNHKERPNCPLRYAVNDKYLDSWCWTPMPLERLRPRVEVEVFLR